MLDVSFDTLWKRHERERRRKIALTCVSTPIILALLYWFIVPCSIDISIKDAKHQLPISKNEDGSVATVTVNGTDYLINNLDTVLHVSTLPGYYRGRNVEVDFSATYYNPLTIAVPLGYGLSTLHELQLERDKSFSIFAGKVLDAVTGSPVEGAIFSFDNGKYTSNTDAKGHFYIEIPIEDQREYKDVVIKKDGYRDFASEEETVDADVVFMLHR